MKKKLISIAIILATAGMIFGVVSGHIPIAHVHTDSICWGYAQGRAFGKTAGDAECDPAHTYADHIYENYFPLVLDPTLAGIKIGDIVVFGEGIRAGGNGHAAFVVGVPNPLVINNITVDQVPNQGGLEQKGKLISEVRLSQGPPVGYHLGIGSATVTLTFNNSFGSGTINVGKDKFGNYLQRPSGWSGSFYTGTTVDINAIDGQQNSSGITQRFLNWRDPSNNILTNQQNYTLPISGSGTYTAKFENEFSATFQNSFPGAIGGQIKVRDTVRVAPYDAKRRESEPQNITAEALY